MSSVSLRRILRELGRPPSPAESEALQARVYASPAWLEPYAKPAYAESGLFDTEQVLVERHLKPGMRLLDVGCGTGREAVGFARAGLVVTALDVCREAIERAPRHERVTYGTGGLASLEGHRGAPSGRPDFAPGSFDAAFLSSDVYGSHPGRANRIAALAGLARIVRPGGPILLPAVLVPARRRLRRRLLDALAGGERGDRYVAGPGGELLYRHVFAGAEEVLAEVAAAGLAGERVGESGWFVARARARRFKRDPDVRAEPHGDELLLVHLRHGTTFRLNGTGRSIFALAGEGLSPAEIAERLRGELDVDPLRLEADARELLEELAAARLLVAA